MGTLEICVILSLLFGFAFLWYVIGLVATFLRQKPSPSGDPAAFQWHFLVPCRDEAAVIGGTIGYLRGTFPAGHVWIIDDASADATAAIAQRSADADPAVHVVRRVLPEARTGKGDALNAGYRAVLRWLAPGTDPEFVVVCVVDADGSPSANILEVGAGPALFGDPGIGAAQVEVRMSNREERAPLPAAGPVSNAFAAMLARMQDVEFRGPISAIQMLRRRTGTVNLGGNGQMVRLAALDDLAADGRGPWGNALLEDFEIGLRLMLAGWRIGYTTTAWVDQEALWNLRALLVQRTRWAQGSMQCLRYLPRVWSSTYFTNAGLFEVSYFMAQPWLQILGTIAYPVPVAVLLVNAARYPDFTVAFLRDGGAMMLALYMMIGVGEFAVWAWAYRRRCETGLSRRYAALVGVSLTAYAWLSYVIAWRALGRLVSGKSSWRKTRRNAEGTAVVPEPRTMTDGEGAGLPTDAATVAVVAVAPVGAVGAVGAAAVAGEPVGVGPAAEPEAAR
jgi:cellulose synthase/poly-beta-1,6-N-acetylglucosamine synthase-like glycosyltransferase